MREVAVERRHDISRLEGFNDAVLGFALTRLVPAPAVSEPARVHELS